MTAKTTKNAETQETTNMMDQFKETLREQVRAQIESELNQDLDKVEEFKEAQNLLKIQIVQLNSAIDDLKSQRNAKASELNEVNTFLLKFSPEAIDALISERINGMLDALAGKTVKPKKTRSTSTKTANLNGYEVTWAIDGQPRSFTSKTHMCQAISRKIGHKITVDELNAVFQAQSGFVPFTEEHKTHGAIDAEFDGIIVSIMVR